MAISWNDLNDSSELSDASDQPPKSQNKQPENLAPTSLQKVLSNPEPKIKPRQDPNDKIAESLKKLSNHEGQYVWLFLFDHFDRDFDIISLLKSIKGVKSVLANQKIINLQVEVKYAQELIEKGYIQKGIKLNFIYSTKNEPFQPRSPRDNLRKPQKKYSEKNPDPRQDNFYEARSPNSKYRFEQKRSYGERADKKKVKYVAKEPKREEAVEKKVDIEEIQERNENSSVSSGLNKKESIESVGQQKKEIQKSQAEGNNIMQKSQEQEVEKKCFSKENENNQKSMSTQIEGQNKAQIGQQVRENEKIKEESKGAEKEQAKDQSDLSSQQKQESKAKKKKNKKKKKSSANNDVEKKKVYGNNPFSFFT